MTEFAAIAAVMAAVAAACAVPGVFLLLRKATLVADAISHVLLLGIVLAYFVVRDVGSPWLMLGASASGVLTVALVELLQRTNRVKTDAAIGLVFPALFALGTILATLYTKNVHLDGDQVLLGHVELSAFDQFVIEGRELGPRAAWLLGGLFAVNAGLAAAFFKELKLATFDPALAAALGFAPGLIHYALMTAVSVTAVAAFDAVGPVLVVAFLVVPSAAAYLLTDRLAVLLVLSVGIGVAAAVAGAWVAVRFDTNVAGTGATLLGVVFGVVWVVAPGRGLIAGGLRRWRNRRAFHETMLAIHLLQHEGTPAEADESRIDGLHRHLRWEPTAVAAVVRRAERNGLVVRAGAGLRLTPVGRGRAREVLGSSVA